MMCFCEGGPFIKAHFSIEKLDDLVILESPIFAHGSEPCGQEVRSKIDIPSKSNIFPRLLSITEGHDHWLPSKLEARKG